MPANPRQTAPPPVSAAQALAIPAANLAADTGGCGIAPPVWQKLARLGFPEAAPGEGVLQDDSVLNGWQRPERRMASGLAAPRPGLAARRRKLDMGTPAPGLTAQPWLDPVMCPFGGDFGTR